MGPERLWVGVSAWISRLAWIGSELKHHCAGCASQSIFSDFPSVGFPTILLAPEAANAVSGQLRSALH